MKKYVIISVVFLVVLFIIIFSIYSKDDNNTYESHLAFSSDRIELIEGGGVLLSLTKINLRGTLEFFSNNDSVVSVNDFGFIKGLKPGKALITVKYNGENKLLTDTIQIIVMSKYDAKLLSINHEIQIGNDGWNKTNVVAKVNVNDANNVGIKSLKYSINCLEDNCSYQNLSNDKLITITNDGKNVVFIEAIDNEGTIANDMFEVLIDKTEPIIEFDVPGGSYENKKIVNVKVSDLTSGLKFYDVNVYKNGIRDNSLSKSNIIQESYMVNLNADATWDIEVNAFDNVGNSKRMSQKYTIKSMEYIEGPGGDRYKKTITYKGRTYKIFNQYSYTDVSFWGGNLGSRGCGPVSLAIALSGYDSNITPVDTAKIMQYGTFERIRYALKQLGHSDNGIIYYNSNDQDEERVKSTINEVRAHLAKGYPLIVLVTHYSEKNSKYSNCGGPYKYAETNHFMAILGEKKNGELIIGNSGGGAQTGTLDEIVRCYLGGGGFGFLRIIP